MDVERSGSIAAGPGEHGREAALVAMSATLMEISPAMEGQSVDFVGERRQEQESEGGITHGLNLAIRAGAAPSSPAIDRSDRVE